MSIKLSVRLTTALHVATTLFLFLLGLYCLYEADYCQNKGKFEE